MGLFFKSNFANCSNRPDNLIIFEPGKIRKRNVESAGNLHA